MNSLRPNATAQKQAVTKMQSTRPYKTTEMMPVNTADEMVSTGKTVLLSIEKATIEEMASSNVKQCGKKTLSNKSHQSNRAKTRKKVDKTVKLEATKTTLPTATSNINGIQPGMKILPIVLVQQSKAICNGETAAATAAPIVAVPKADNTKMLVVNSSQLTAAMVRPQVVIEAPIRKIDSTDVKVNKPTIIPSQTLLPNNSKPNGRMQECIHLPISIRSTLCKPNQVAEVVISKKGNASSAFQTNCLSNANTIRNDIVDAKSATDATICYIQGPKNNSCIKSK